MTAPMVERCPACCGEMTRPRGEGTRWKCGECGFRVYQNTLDKLRRTADAREAEWREAIVNIRDGDDWSLAFALLDKAGESPPPKRESNGV